MNYQRTNNLIGWTVFGLSLLVYVLTLEPTASFWDCGEFIAVARHLQTPHPPGAPIFSLLGRVFSLMSGEGWSGFSFSEDAAYWINMVSAVSGAFTSLFLFWSITMFSRKILKNSKEKSGELTLDNEGKVEYSIADKIAIFGAGFVGAMACTFCDSIWFSSVEAEVYAISLFFTSFVVWAMLRRSFLTEQIEKDRWMILIAYMVGLSIGVHLLNLVAIPALALIVYYENNKATLKGTIITIVISAVILMSILSGLPGLTSIAFWFDRVFNSLGLPFNFGAYFFLAALIGGLVYGIMYSIQNNKRILNVALLSTSFILIGFFSYFIIVIRSQQDPTIDENNPDDLVNFISYLNREQYGDRPLFFGPQYNIDLQESWKKHFDTYGHNGEQNYMKKYGAVKYKKEDGSYVAYDTAESYVYPSEAESFLPRMYSGDQGHVQQYTSLLSQYNNDYYPMEYSNGERISFTDNIHYFFDRQLGRMYFRYFLWNFAGRERQEQYANWMMPQDLANEDLPAIIRHPARNNFYLIPLIIGFIGLIYQLYKDQNNFIVVITLFLFTGVAIIFYLNAPPTEPRERDYAYAGSYFAFCIWIGLAVMALYDFLGKALKHKLGAASVSLAVCIIAPSIMGAVGWDDHDRSRRYFSVDSAKNLLNSCEKNAILFTAGDNDTFPLWYVQEVEGFRTDVRVCNLSLLNTDWYAEQMTRQAHESAPLPISFAPSAYIQGSLDYLPFNINSRKNLTKLYYEKAGEQSRYNPMKDPGFSLDRYISLVRELSPKVMDSYDDKNFMPFKIARKFTIPVDSAKTAQLAWIPKELKSRVVNEMSFDNGEGALYKKDIIMLDIINSVAKSGWDRPIYFSTTAGSPGGDNFQGIKEYLQQEALAFRLIPAVNYGQMNQELTHKILKEDFSYRGLTDKSICYTDDYERMVYGTQAVYIQLAMSYIGTNQKDKAKDLFTIYHKNISEEVFPWNSLSPSYLSVYYDIYGDEAGDKEYNKISKIYFDVIKHYITTGDHSEHREEHIGNALRILGYDGKGLTEILTSRNRTELLKTHQAKMSQISKTLGF